MYRWRTEGESPAREAAAVGIGVFIGCTPFFGFHFLLCMAAGWALRLNRMKVYLAANIPNVFVVPAIFFGEVQAGAWLRRGQFHGIDFQTFRAMSPWSLGADLLLGALVVGGLLGLIAGTAMYSISRRSALPSDIAALLRDAADRYLPCGVFGWEFAKAKLRRDPVYRSVLQNGWLPAEGTILDLGCGRGLMLTLMATARQRASAGSWPAGWATPTNAKLKGIEYRPEIAALAQRVLGSEATVVPGDLRTAALERSRGILIFDVLHLLSGPDQEALLTRIAAALEPGGTLLVREADASAGWGFRVTQLGNWMTAIWRRDWQRRFHYRGAGEWRALLEARGFRVEMHHTSAGTPFANVLFQATSEP